MTHTAFTIGACYVNGFKMLLGILKCVAQSDGIVQVFFISSSPNAGKHGQTCVQIFDGFGVIHFSKIRPEMMNKYKELLKKMQLVTAQ